MIFVSLSASRAGQIMWREYCASKAHRWDCFSSSCASLCCKDPKRFLGLQYEYRVRRSLRLHTLVCDSPYLHRAVSDWSQYFLFIFHSLSSSGNVSAIRGFSRVDNLYRNIENVCRVFMDLDTWRYRSGAILLWWFSELASFQESTNPLLLEGPSGSYSMTVVCTLHVRLRRVARRFRLFGFVFDNNGLMPNSCQGIAHHGRSTVGVLL